MTWTPNKPKVPGWYWWKNKEGVVIVQISNFYERPLMAFMVTGRREELAGLIGQWCGPLEPPVDTPLARPEEAITKEMI